MMTTLKRARVRAWLPLVLLAGAVFLTAQALCGETPPPLFRFVHLTDSHCMFPEDLDKAKDFGGRIYSRSFEIFGGALVYIEQDVKPAFVVHTGDIVENGGWKSGLATMQKARDMVAARGVRFFPVFGNHDNSGEKFEQVFGLDRYTFTCGNTLFIVLRCLNDFPALRQRSLHIPKSVLYQLDDLLARWRGNVVVCLHEPLRCHENEERWARVTNHELIISLLERHKNVAMVLQGHTHFFFRKRVGGIEYVTAPGLVNVNKVADRSLCHGMLVYDVYPDRIECSLHGAPSTDAAVKGDYSASEKVRFTVPLPRRAALGRDYTAGLRPRRLPLAVDRYDAEIEQGVDPVAFYLFSGWRFRADPDNRGKELGWHAQDLDASTWKQVKKVYLRNPWETYLAKGYDGYAWYRIAFTVPEGLRGMQLEVALGRIDDCDETYLNGSLVGRTGAFPPEESTSKTAKVSRLYRLPPNVVKYGAENVLAVRVFDSGGTGGLLGLPYVRIRRTVPPAPKRAPDAPPSDTTEPKQGTEQDAAADGDKPPTR